VSIASNLAEGCGRQSDRELGRFVGIALGSASEVEYQLLLARDLGYLETREEANLGERVVEVKRMLGSLLSRIDRRTTALNPLARSDDAH
jgi:four helix bundle protein